MNFSIPASPTAVDLNNDGYIDRVYIGDVGGQLWKFDVAPTGGATFSGSLVNNWTGKRLFAAASSQTNPPARRRVLPDSSHLFSANACVRCKQQPLDFLRDRRSVPPKQYFFKPFLRNQRKHQHDKWHSADGVVSHKFDVGHRDVSQGWYVALGSNEKVLGFFRCFQFGGSFYNLYTISLPRYAGRAAGTQNSTQSI